MDPNTPVCVTVASASRVRMLLCCRSWQDCKGRKGNINDRPAEQPFWCQKAVFVSLFSWLYGVSTPADGGPQTSISSIRSNHKLMFVPVCWCVCSLACLSSWWKEAAMPDRRGRPAGSGRQRYWPREACVDEEGEKNGGERLMREVQDSSICLFVWD